MIETGEAGVSRGESVEGGVSKRGPAEGSSEGVRHSPDSEGSTGADPSSSGRGLGGFRWLLPEGVSLEECVLLWVGDPDCEALLSLQMTLNR